MDGNAAGGGSAPCARQERLAIARDLHDIVAHHVSVIAVQAEAAQAVLETQPERAGQAMEDVADTARGALVELRRLLGVLRSEHDFAPQPGLDSIDDLVESVRHAGMDVRLSRAVRPVDAVAGLTAYRVVQEALTNVLKHAGPCATDISVAVRDDALIVCVVDDGPVPARGTAATGWSACGSGSRCSAARWTRARATGGFAVRAGCRCRHDDPRRRRRRPGARAERVRMILDAQDDIEVVGEADDGDTAVEVAHRLRPDVVLMDVRMPRMDGITATRRWPVRMSRAR